jgi:hypothetical protein
MPNTMDDLLKNIHALETEIEAEIAKRREAFHYEVKHRRAVFEEEVAKQHKQLKTNLWRYMKNANLLTILTAPVIYSVIVPFVMLDIFVTIYQAICFPVYGISKVSRGDHIIFDRHQLNYLNALEKFNCFYCSYGNGLIGYAREIASRTEQYWCPIKHARAVANFHQRYPAFADFGDAENYQEILEQLRAQLSEELQKNTPPKK